MFRNLFNKSQPKTSGNAAATDDPVAAAMKRAIAEQKKKDPLAGLKIGSKEINQRLISMLKDDRGVHVETLLTILGAVAGYACQFSVREEFVKPGTLPENKAFVIAEAKNGRRYFFGDALNKPLAEAKYSVWGLAAGAAQNLGKPVPDINDIFKHVSATVGGDQFGIQRLPDSHRPGDLPINYLKVFWPQILPLASQYCDHPYELPVLFGLAIQETIVMAKTVIDPSLAVTIAMESAVPMSKVDLAAA
jgi:hypothetical protein